MNLNIWNDVINALLPSLSNIKTHEISYIWLVKGAAIDDSASERDIPISADFKALQSLAPSPHIPISFFKNSYKLITKDALSSGDILA